MRDGPTLVDLPVVNLRDVPALLRSLADRIESGECGDVQFVACAMVRRDHSQKCFGFGDVNMHEAVGAFSWAASHMSDWPED